MNLTIHRGTHEIGGTCIELKSDGFRLMLDFGMPLVSEDGGDFFMPRDRDVHQLIEDGLLPSIPGIYDDSGSKDTAVLLSHAHADHSGFLRFLSPSIHVYMSTGTEALMKISSIFPPKAAAPENARTIKAWEEIQIGPVRVAP